MPEKKEGATMTCGKCKTLLTCHSKTYKKSDRYEAKTVLQWQNSDGSAHYSTNNGKDFSCNIPETDEREQIVQESQEIPETIDAFSDKPSSEKQKVHDDKIQELIVKTHNNEEISKVYSEIDKLIALEQMIKDKFVERGIDLNVQKIGMYMKLLREVD